MLVLGHAGITLGAASLLSHALMRKRFSSEAACPNDLSASKVSWIASAGSHIDVRVLLIGSLLSDIIDKPVGQFFFRDTFSNGRIFSHTLIFLLVIVLVGFYLYRRWSKGWLLVLSFGIFTHLILDQMWRSPQTLFWPIWGFSFVQKDLTGWVPGMLHGLVANPEVYVPELLGTVLLLWFGLVLLRRRKVSAFIKSGRVC